MLALASQSDTSKLRIRMWVERLVLVLIKEGKHLEVGPALCSESGYVLSQNALNAELWSILTKVRGIEPYLLSGDIELERKYYVFHSFKRGATT